MKVQLLRDSRIMHKTGEIVEVSPADGAFLLSVQSAVIVDEQPKKAVKTARGEKTKGNSAK